METVKLKVHACLECGFWDHVKVGQTSVGCRACRRFAVCTDTHSAVTIWNLQNPICVTTTCYGLTISEEDKRNYYLAMQNNINPPESPLDPETSSGQEGDLQTNSD